jgi:hypothetical protein
MPRKTANAASGVDWKTLKTVSGPATRVPRLVDLLVAGKTPEDRDEAWCGFRPMVNARIGAS